MFNLAFAAMNRGTTQSRDTRQESDLACAPLKRQKPNKVSPVLFMERYQDPIDCLMLLRDLTMWMLPTGDATTSVDETTF